MKIESKNQQTCENCAHCVKHYANYDGKYYLVTGCMHCINNKIPFKERKRRVKYAAECDCWEPEEKQIIARRESIKVALLRISRRLEEIAQILQDDSQDR